jgi:hypothetical protein
MMGAPWEAFEDSSPAFSVKAPTECALIELERWLDYLEVRAESGSGVDVAAKPTVPFTVAADIVRNLIEYVRERA